MSYAITRRSLRVRYPATTRDPIQMCLKVIFEVSLIHFIWSRGKSGAYSSNMPVAGFHHFREDRW